MKWLDYIKVVDGNVIHKDKKIEHYDDPIDTANGEIKFGKFLYQIEMTYLMEIRGAGVTKPNLDGSDRQEYLADLKEKGGVVWFEPERGNRWDASAVKIVWQNKCLGYIPAICKIKQNIYYNPNKYIFLGYEVIGGGDGAVNNKPLSYGISIKIGQIHE